MRAARLGFRRLALRWRISAGALASWRWCSLQPAVVCRVHALRDAGALSGGAAERLRLLRRRAPQDDGGQPEERGAFASGGTARRSSTGDIWTLRPSMGLRSRLVTVRAAHEKGGVENALMYRTKPPRRTGPDESERRQHRRAPVARRWRNARLHAPDPRKPAETFHKKEKPNLLPLPMGVYDLGVVRSVHATNRCRVVFDTNRYSVPYDMPPAL